MVELFSWQERRMKVEEDIWNGAVKSMPKFGEVCMAVQVDM